MAVSARHANMPAPLQLLGLALRFRRQGRREGLQRFESISDAARAKDHGRVRREVHSLAQPVERALAEAKRDGCASGVYQDRSGLRSFLTSLGYMTMPGHFRARISRGRIANDRREIMLSVFGSTVNAEERDVGCVYRVESLNKHTQFVLETRSRVH